MLLHYRILLHVLMSLGRIVLHLVCKTSLVLTFLVATFLIIFVDLTIIDCWAVDAFPRVASNVDANFRVELLWAISRKTFHIFLFKLQMIFSKMGEFCRKRKRLVKVDFWELLLGRNSDLLTLVWKLSSFAALLMIPCLI